MQCTIVLEFDNGDGSAVKRAQIMRFHMTTEEVWWSTNSGPCVKILFRKSWRQSVVELMGPYPVVPVSGVARRQEFDCRKPRDHYRLPSGQIGAQNLRTGHRPERSQEQLGTYLSGLKVIFLISPRVIG
ncbi:MULTISPECIES: hypothetical protein [Burkholderia]|uniref:Uncharacterized protein n=1 Tax=Burkholderia vietnamiensis TaxID=60552 RepID=A0A2Z6TRY8_BURVI|nr:MULTISPECIES: hypothetical protein [Burkholderia]MBR7908033.1 hypothetical protein [Burkholderia vietnamiensis]MCA8206663.1 hypothetical protein [Burkholderia vietnamiensis]MCO1347128.1 hypothetical protein [Burkholderia vietnamiensis]MCO1428780.1 hypothetical protein [Burkholderia vietnamiensis]PRH40719.1 hypothetical protein C6T65_19530 [Burkholderia vietnamiensis]